MESTVSIGDPPTSQPDALSGTNLKSALKTAEALAAPSVMGMSAAASRFANVAAVALIAVMFTIAFLWLRADAMSERADYRAQVLRAEQQNDDRRREDRIDRQRTEDLFRATLETLTRDNRESMMQMKIVSEQVRISSDQMKAATEAMVRVEKLLTMKQRLPDSP